MSRDLTTKTKTSSTPDLVWRAQISGLLAELTREVLALTETVMEMSQKLAAGDKE